MTLYPQPPKDVADIIILGFDYESFLEGDTIASSSWTVVPSANITISNSTFTPTDTEVRISGGDAGETYRITNLITTSGGAAESRTAILPVTAEAVTGSYLGVSEATARLWGRFGVEAELTSGDLLAASSELDSMGPWIGSKQDSGQTLSFPRSVNLDGTTNTDLTAPAAILDAVALLAHHESSDEGPAVTSESVLDRSLTYATPKVPQALTRIENLIKPYQLKVGQRVGVSAYEITED